MEFVKKNGIKKFSRITIYCFPACYSVKDPVTLLKDNHGDLIICFAIKHKTRTEMRKF